MSKSRDDLPKTREAVAEIVALIREIAPDAQVTPMQACRRCGLNLWDSASHDEEWNCRYPRERDEEARG